MVAGAAVAMGATIVVSPAARGMARGLRAAVRGWLAGRSQTLREVRAAPARALHSWVDVPTGGWLHTASLAASGRDRVSIPVAWDLEQHVRWFTAIPGRGHSTPVLVDDAMLLTTADASAGTQSIVCIDAPSGSLRWSRVVHRGRLGTVHEKGSHASATVASDGNTIYAAFSVNDRVWITAITLDGTIRWQADVGPCLSRWGYAGSPVVWGHLVVTSCDNPRDGWMAAVDRRDGTLVWRRRRPDAPEGSYGSVVVVRRPDRVDLVLGGAGTLAAYAGGTGDVLWEVNGLPSTFASSPACSAEWIVASGGWPDRVLVAIRCESTEEAPMARSPAWSARASTKAPYTPSPVLAGDDLYLLVDEGIVSRMRVGAGTQVWRKRVGGNFSASPLLLDDRLTVASEAGAISVIDTASGDVLATNELPDGCYATPVIGPDGLYVRTTAGVYCIADDDAR